MRLVASILALGLLIPVTALGQYLEAVVPVGHTPVDVLWNPTSNKVYVANNQDASITIIDGSTNQVISTLQVPDYPGGLCWNSQLNKVYCATGESGRLAVIDGVGDTVIAVRQVAGYPCNPVYNAQMNKLYVSCFDDQQVVVIDAGPDTVVKTVAVRRVGRLLWHPVTNRVFAVGDSLTVIDCATDEVVERLDAGGTAFCYNQVNGFVYLTAHSVVYVVTPAGDSTAAVISGYAFGICAVPVPNKVYASCVPGIYVIDGATSTVVDTIPSVGGHLLSDTTLVKVYCVSYSPGVAHVIDANADTLIKSIPLGRYPDLLCWNRTNSRVYITDQMDAVVYVIRDTSTGILESGRNRVVCAPIRALPNPFADRVTVEWPQSTYRVEQVEVYSLVGSLVTSLHLRVGSDGALCATWDGRDEHGMSVAPGVYFMAAAAGPRVAVVKAR